MQPLPIPSALGAPTAVQRANESLLELRINQRLVAEVLRVATDHVVLALEGTPVVARLTSPDQAAHLAERRAAQFIVRDTSGHTLTLQLAHAEAAPAPAEPPAAPVTTLLRSLLQQAGVEASEANIVIARALIEHGLPVTASSVADLQSALAGLATARAQPGPPPGLPANPAPLNQGVSQGPAWGPPEAQLAAALKAAGLPLSPGALALARTPETPLGQLAGLLQSRLAAVAAVPLPARQAALVSNALETLAAVRVDWSAPAPELAAQLHQAVAVLGRAVERQLAELIAPRPAADPAGQAAQPGAAPADRAFTPGRSPDPAFDRAAFGPQARSPGRTGDATESLMKPQAGLLGLAQLQGELNSAASPAGTVGAALERFLDSARLAQLVSAAPEPPATPAPARSADVTALSLSLPLGGPAEPLPHTAHLRVAYRPEGESGPEADGRSRLRALVVRAELDEGQALEVELSMVGRQVGARVSASDADLRDRAQAELPALQAGLQGLGYSLKVARCEVSRPAEVLPGDEADKAGMESYV